ncbi:MAG: hypothetical protein ACJAYG_001444 [Oceanicoccus sp.]|jgi:hypothetical protein
MVKRTRADKKASKPQLSSEALAQAQTITNTVVPVSFTKQQRREVQQAIESGMATVRAQASSKNRERDKKVKQSQKQLAAKEGNFASAIKAGHEKSTVSVMLPWCLLALTWIGVGFYLTDIMS